jgi:hypothetical protein
MNGARFVDDQLELAGWEVLISDVQKVRGLAPLACKTDRIDARVLKSFEDSAVWDFAGGRRHVTAARPVQRGAMLSLSLFRRHSSRPSAS